MSWIGRSTGTYTDELAALGAQSRIDRTSLQTLFWRAGKQEPCTESDIAVRKQVEYQLRVGGNATAAWWNRPGSFPWRSAGRRLAFRLCHRPAGRGSARLSTVDGIRKASSATIRIIAIWPTRFSARACRIRWNVNSECKLLAADGRNSLGVDGSVGTGRQERRKIPAGLFHRYQQSSKSRRRADPLPQSSGRPGCRRALPSWRRPTTNYRHSSYSVSHDLRARAAYRRWLLWSGAGRGLWRQSWTSRGATTSTACAALRSVWGELIDTLLNLARLARSDALRDSQPVAAGYGPCWKSCRTPIRSVKITELLVAPDVFCPCRRQAAVRPFTTCCRMRGNSLQGTKGKNRIRRQRMVPARWCITSATMAPVSTWRCRASCSAHFQRLQSIHEFEGIGVGLATRNASFIAIAAKSGPAERRQGATFYFTLGQW